MDRIKKFLRSKWIYRLTDNQVFAFECGIVAMSMGSAFLFALLAPQFFLGEIKEIVVASVILVVGFILVIAVVISFHKTREEIK